MHRCTPNRQRRRLSRRGGFTLLEMLLVLTIIGLLAGTAAWNLVGTGERVRVQRTKTDLIMIKSALTAYHMERGRYPDAIDGLGGALIDEKYLEKEPFDPWGEQYFYVVPHPYDDTKPYEVYSMGPDGIGDTEDDITVWEADEQ